MSLGTFILVLTSRNFSEFFSTMAVHAAHQSQFFISYVLVAGGLQVFMRLSQGPNAILHFTMKRMTKEEATSERRLDHVKKDIRSFHLDEFVPLFLFVFMIGVLYGWIAPIANLFVYGFFKAAYKVFRFMVGSVGVVIGRTT
jgi:phosphatidylglycerophosphatase A